MIATGIRPLLARIFEVKIWRRALERVCFGFSAHCLGFARLCRTCGACEAGHVILRGTRTEAEPALDFREAHQAFIKRSFSKGSFLEVVLVSKIQDPRSTILPGRPRNTRKHAGSWNPGCSEELPFWGARTVDLGSWMLDLKGGCLLWGTQVSNCKIRAPKTVR